MSRPSKLITLNCKKLTLQQAAAYLQCSYIAVWCAIKKHGETEAIKKLTDRRKVILAPCESCGSRTRGVVCNNDSCKLKRCAKLYAKRNPESVTRTKKRKHDQDKSQQFRAGKRGKNDYRCHLATKCDNYDRYMQKTDWKKPCVPDGKCFKPFGQDRQHRNVIFDSILEG